MNDLADPHRRRFLTGRLLAERPVAAPAAPAVAGDGPRIAVIGDGCLPRQGVDCQVCRDACPTDAIRFRPRRGGPFLPELRADACTGCGDCLPSCPAAAIRLERAAAPSAPEAAHAG